MKLQKGTVDQRKKSFSITQYTAFPPKKYGFCLIYSLASYLVFMLKIVEHLLKEGRKLCVNPFLIQPKEI
jgi:hypothetical protein